MGNSVPKLRRPTQVADYSGPANRDVYVSEVDIFFLQPSGQHGERRHPNTHGEVGFRP